MRLFFLGSCGLMALASASQPALAQDAAAVAAPKAAAATDTGGLQEIVVTAQRRSENLQKAAIAITAVSGDQLIAAGVTKPTELTSLVPALQVATAAGPYSLFYLRGVGNFNGNALSDAAIAFNVDGVYIAHPSSTTGFFYDLERVEVLKGPQGTLYGRNATGGAINVITHKPELGVLGGDASFEYGNYDSVRVNGALNVPLSDIAALRVAGTRNKHDGYMSDGTDDQNDAGGRISLRVDPTPDLKIVLSADYFSQRGRGTGSVAIAQGPSNRIGLTSPQGQAFYEAQPSAVGGRTLLPLQPAQFMRNHFWGTSATIDWTTPIGTVTFVPAYRESSLNYRTTTPGFQIDQHENDKQTSLELRLASNSDGPLSYLIGGYYFNGTSAVPFYSTNAQFNASIQDYTQRTKSIAGFGRLSYEITDGLKLTGGARYTTDKKRYDAIFLGANIICALPTTFYPTFVGGCPNAQPVPYGATTLPAQRFVPGPDGTIVIGSTLLNNESARFNKPTYHAGLDWDITSRNLLYFSFESGFKSGGFFSTNSTPTATDPQPGTYRPETINAWTIGSKNRFFDNKLQLNIEGFYWRYKDQQISHLGLSSTGAVIFPTENVGRATMKGFEIDSQYLPFENTLLTADIQYLDARYNQFIYNTPNVNGGVANGTGCPNVGVPGVTYTVDCSGFGPPNAPKWTINLGAQQTIPLASGAKFVLNARTHYQSQTLTGLEFTAIEYQDSYWQSDASLTYAAPSDRYYVTAFVNNIENTTVVANSFPPPLTFITVGSLRPPRTYGIRAGVHF